MKENAKQVLFFFLFLIIGTGLLSLLISYLNKNDPPSFREYLIGDNYDSDSLGTFYTSAERYKKISDDTIMFKAYIGWKKGKMISDGYIVKSKQGNWIYNEENYTYKFFAKQIKVDSLMVRFIDGSECDL